MSDGLYAVERGGEASRRDTPALVFLHGFGGNAEVWSHLQDVFATPTQATIAFDLPGHGRSLDYPGFGPPKIAARAVLAELDRRDIANAHIVGHSMGGAVASLMALFAPDRVASLTLIAPGGFGEAIGVDEIRAVMNAETPDALAKAMAGMGASGWEPSWQEVEATMASRTPENRKAVAAVFDQLFAAGRQGVLPLDAIAACGRPVRLLWGERDPVTPHRQGVAAPFELTAVPGAGHLLMQEAPEACRAAIAASMSAARSVHPIS